jgi:curli biogenesis system outer membrane secretion channel CsgG
MKTLTIAATLAALTLATAAPAMADATRATCGQMAAKVNEALNGVDNPEARNEQRAGTTACSVGFYDNGVSHYRKALSLLGK